MRHTREEIIQRTIKEFELLDHLITNLKLEDWDRLVPRPETKDPWTAKDAHWKADVIRSIKRQPIPVEERGLNITDGNHLIFQRWHNRPPQDVLAWHRQVQQEVLAALRDAPEVWFTGKERKAEWPNDLDGHSVYHRVRDIERALAHNAVG